VINRFPDVERPTPLPGALDRALFAILAAAGKLLGLRIPRTSRTPTATGSRRWRRSLVAELLPPVVRTAFRGEIKEVPERLEGCDVAGFLIAVRRRVEEL
jgi:hypothetical protein